jgi:ribosomal protein S18 acetylase RimI-like enzyme
MNQNLSRVANFSPLKKKLEDDVIGNSSFIAKVFHGDGEFKVFATQNHEAGVAIHESRNHLIFFGDWTQTELPFELLPSAGFFVSSSPPEAIERLRPHYVATGEWPCWHYLAPEGFGPGDWDGLGPILPEEVPSISKYWTLSEEPAREMAERVGKYDSACVRVDGAPVSWCGMHFEIEGVGNLGFAHTLEGHRRKGYAALVTKALVNRLAARGRRGTVHVIKDNANSIALCQSMGFRVVGELTWAEFSPIA